jgi:N-acetylneuraminic acid mutarotase
VNARLLLSLLVLGALTTSLHPLDVRGEGWELLNPPSPRSQHASVWDPVGRRMLVFGGVGGANLGDLWSFEPSNNRWTQLFPEGARPARLVGHTVVWDAGRERVLQFGGHGIGGGGLWSYDPGSNQWELLQTAGRAPAARGFHSAVWDPAREWMFVYGGIGPSAEILDDLWAFDVQENSWIELPRPTMRPRPRFYQAAVWDPSEDQMLVFAGADLFRGVLFDDLWSYRPATNTWTEIAPVGARPDERLSHTLVWDPTLGRVLMYGGGCGAGCYHEDLWSYQPGARVWQPLAAVGGALPGRRGGHTAVWDVSASRLLLFGGSSVQGSTNELWSYLPRTSAWTRYAGRWDGSARLSAFGLGWLEPAPRQGHSAAWDEERSELLMFGGQANDRWFDDLWAYAPRIQSWRPLTIQGEGPSARARAGAAWDAEHRQLYLFGGSGPDGYLDELWRLDAETRTWEQLEPNGSPPDPAEDLSLVWDPVREQLIAYGGTRGQGGTTALHAYRPSIDRWVALEADQSASPVPRYRQSAVWDPAGERMLVFAGYGGPSVGNYLDDLWSYDPATGGWEQLAVGQSAPPTRAWHRAAWDPVGERLVVTGGFAGGVDYLDDAWAYDPARDVWEELQFAEPVPTARAQHSAVWAGDGLLIYGGSGGSLNAEMWRLRLPGGE